MAAGPPQPYRPGLTPPPRVRLAAAPASTVRLAPPDRYPGTFRGPGVAAVRGERSDVGAGAVDGRAYIYIYIYIYIY